MRLIMTLGLAFMSALSLKAQSNNYWQNLAELNISNEQKFVNVETGQYLSLSHSQLLPQLQTLKNNQSLNITLPNPDGHLEQFIATVNDLMPTALQEKFPGIKTFNLKQKSPNGVFGKMEVSNLGIRAMLFTKKGTFYIEPASTSRNENYVVFYKKDYLHNPQSEGFCEQELGSSVPTQEVFDQRTHGTTLRSYRAAVSCTYQYSVAVAGSNPTKADVLSAIVTTMNRVAGVYEKEVAVTFTLIPNQDTLIVIDGGMNFNNTNASVLINQNQNFIDSLIGTSGYDIGHIFSTGAGGLAQLRSVCNANTKARGVTGRSIPRGDAFDIDYVAHEIGHQFGAQHTFNAATGSCAGNGSQNSAYEPGSGSTIMAYAGICQASNNIQQNSNDYFHAHSLIQITDFLSTATCATTTSTNNTSPQINDISREYFIPFKTPFEISESEAIDSDNDGWLSYSWEQWDRGQFRESFSNTNYGGPIFRSFLPDSVNYRVFPTLTRLLVNTSTYLGEKLPDTNRVLNFKLTVRDTKNGIGSHTIADQNFKINAVHTGVGFAITSFNTSRDTLYKNHSQLITWEVASTDIAPINTSHVDILLSLDGGRTWPIVLASNTPNDGSESVLMPDVVSTRARIKIKGVNNIFFDINNSNLQLIDGIPSSIKPIWNNTDITLSPNPAQMSVSVQFPTKLGSGNYKIFNAVGQVVMEGQLENGTMIALPKVPTGQYYFQSIFKDQIFTKGLTIVQ